MYDGLRGFTVPVMLIAKANTDFPKGNFPVNDINYIERMGF